MLSLHYLLILPTDQRRRARIQRQLAAKSRQYEERMATFLTKAIGSKTQYYLNEYLYCFIRVLLIARLLKDGWVQIHDIQRDLITAKQINEAHEAIFFGAVAVIIDYVAFNGEHVSNGTGLPNIRT